MLRRYTLLNLHHENYFKILHISSRLKTFFNHFSQMKSSKITTSLPRDVEISNYFSWWKFIGFIIIFSTYYHVTIYLAFACDQQQYCIHIRCLNKKFLLLALIQVRIIMLIKDDFCCLAILSNHFVICFLFQSKAIVGYFP